MHHEQSQRFLVVVVGLHVLFGLSNRWGSLNAFPACARRAACSYHKSDLFVAEASRAPAQLLYVFIWISEIA
jgi:hypothetical protein